MKSLVRELCPPVVYRSLSKVARTLRPKPSHLFEGGGELFEKSIHNCSVYGEYGCGASTIWVANNGIYKILSVDSSPIWVEHVQSTLHSHRSARIHLADLGEVGEWGRPVSYNKRENFVEYTDWIWLHDERPDTVLIDGRFRVSCFLTSILKAAPGTKVIFDDYVVRPHYHIVEEILKPVEWSKRQALFVVPEYGNVDRKSATLMLEKFRMVFD